jgi:hypothetical protein
MTGNNPKPWRNSSNITVGAVALVAVGGFAVALYHSRPAPPPAVPATSSKPLSEAQRQPEVRPSPNAQPSVNPEFLVLIGIETTPPGARVVRVSDEYLLGRTPDTFEFHQSKNPVQIRIEQEGYIPEMRWVAVVEDSLLSVVLKPDPTKKAATSKTNK